MTDGRRFILEQQRTKLLYPPCDWEEVQTFGSKAEAQDRKAELERGGPWLGNTHFRCRIRSF